MRPSLHITGAAMPATMRLGALRTYVQDTITKNRMTLQLGVRYDFNHDTALAASIGANFISP